MTSIPKTLGLIAFAAFVAVSGLAFAPYSAHACSCMAPGSPQESLESSAAVFQGTVASVASDGDMGYRVTFSADKAWKGVTASPLDVRTARDSAACGFNFEEGKKYIVYAYADEEGALATGLCSRTHELAANDPDVAALGEGSAVTATTTPSSPQEGRSMARNLITLGLGLVAVAAAIALRAARTPQPPTA